MGKSIKGDTDGSAGRIARNIIKLFRPDLRKNKVTVEFVLDRGQLKRNGVPAASVTKVNPVENRLFGCADVRVTLDAAEWDNADQKRRQSIIDEALGFVFVDTEGSLFAPEDCLGRPVVSTRPADYTVTGFHDVDSRNKEYSAGVQGASLVRQRLDEIDVNWATAAELAAPKIEDDAELTAATED